MFPVDLERHRIDAVRQRETCRNSHVSIVSALFGLPLFRIPFVSSSAGLQEPPHDVEPLGEVDEGGRRRKLDSQ
jgi:hypothetical protein